jgi:hypothetical protein
MLTNLKRIIYFARVYMLTKLEFAEVEVSLLIKVSLVSQMKTAMRLTTKEMKQEQLVIVDSILDPPSIAIFCVAIKSGLLLGETSRLILMLPETPATQLQDGKSAAKKNYSTSGNARKLKLSIIPTLLTFFQILAWNTSGFTCLFSRNLNSIVSESVSM